MINIWEFCEWQPYHYDDREVNENVHVHNWEAIMGARSGHFKSWKPATPVIELTITLDGYTPDCFSMEGFGFFSKKLRDVINQPEHIIEYFDVTFERLCPSARAMNYKMFHIIAGEDVVDPEKSEFREATLPQWKDKPSLDRAIMREGAMPIADIFYDSKYPGHMFCTESLAIRSIRAGCTGIRFLDPATMGMGLGMEYRTARGIERSGAWDPINRTLETILVKQLPGLQ